MPFFKKHPIAEHTYTPAWNIIMMMWWWLHSVFSTSCLVHQLWSSPGVLHLLQPLRVMKKTPDIQKARRSVSYPHLDAFIWPSTGFHQNYFGSWFNTLVQFSEPVHTDLMLGVRVLENKHTHTQNLKQILCGVLFTGRLSCGALLHKHSRSLLYCQSLSFFWWSSSLHGRWTCFRLSCDLRVPFSVSIHAVCISID